MVRIIITEIIFFVCFLISSIAGFAGAAFAVPLATKIIGLNNARASVNLISCAHNFVIVKQEYKHIQIKKLIPVILLLIVGMAAGLYINTVFKSEDIMLKILGVIILFIALFNLFVHKKIKLNKPAAAILVIVAGIVQILFLCSGIILVVYMDQKFKIKEELRANNALIFLLLAILVVVYQIICGIYNTTNVTIAAIGVIPIILAAIIGKKIVEKISQKLFSKITYILLIIMSFLLII